MALLQNLSQFAIRKGEGDRFAHVLLNMLLRNLSKGLDNKMTPDLVVIMIKLAAVGKGTGQRDLFLATLDWILKYKEVRWIFIPVENESVVVQLNCCPDGCPSVSCGVQSY